ncbi:MAG: hypothetical protein R3B99_11025 [Polyangiales bacterium]
MRLRDEQLRARVVYVDPTATNAELDAITAAQVVAELSELQHARACRRRCRPTPQSLEIELIKTLRELLEKMVSARREHFLRHKIETIQRKIANLYFASEIRGTPERALEGRAFHHADEALLAALQHQHDVVVADLDRFKYGNPAVKQQAADLLSRVEKKLAADVLARSRPDIERLLLIYRDVLLVFLMKDFRDSLGELAWEVVQKSQIARDGQDLTYKILEKQFPRFRATFEERFMERLLAGIQRPLGERLADGTHTFREETLRFAADPRIYADICAVMCNSIYEYLHGEGFLDNLLARELAKQLYDE